MYRKSDYHLGIDGKLLQHFIDRLEVKDIEIKTIRAEKRDIYREARMRHIDVKALKDIMRMRREDPLVRLEQESTRRLYLEALQYDPRDFAAATARKESDFRPDYEPELPPTEET